MAAPKTVTKVIQKKGHEGEIVFIDNVDRVQYTLTELCKAALRDVGKVVVAKARILVPKRTGSLSKSISRKVETDKDTKQPVLKIGFRKKEKETKSNPYNWYAHLILFGHKTVDGDFVPGNNFILKAVEENVETIRQIQGKYLSAIEDEQKAQALIDENADGEED